MHKHAGCPQGLLEFLACEPYFDGNFWKALMQPYCEYTTPERLLRLCSLLRGVMLRRTKDDVGVLTSPLQPPATPSAFKGTAGTLAVYLHYTMWRVPWPAGLALEACQSGLPAYVDVLVPSFGSAFGRVQVFR